MINKETMNKRQTEYIALYLFVFGAILLFGVLARKFVLVKGYDEFSAAVGFFATVVRKARCCSWQYRVCPSA